MNGASRKRGAMAIVAAIIVMLVGGLEAGPVYARRKGDRPPSAGGSSGQGEELYGCDRTFGRPPEGRLAKHTDPGPGRDVQPGDAIDVSITWEPGDWSSDELHKVLDCVAVDGRLVRSLQAGESPTANDGRFARSYTVPPDAPDGARICDQAMLSGRSPRGDYDRQISNQVCHTVSRNAACCRDGNGCDECRHEAPCDEGCGHRPPCDDKPCGEKPCADKGCDEDGRDCRCERGGDRHRGRLSELLHDLL